MTAERDDAVRVEEAALRAWPALEDVEVAGWHLRYSDGYTKRANSVQAPRGTAVALADQVARCEAWYEERGAPAVFRLTPFSEPGLDAYLSEAGYGVVGRTLVMVCGAEEVGGHEEDSVVRSVSAAEWARWSAALSGRTGGVPPALIRILSRIQPEHLLGLMEAEGADEPLACGLAVADGGLLGLFGLVTHPGHRRQGLGTRLVQALVAWGKARGAGQVYLQVEEENQAARSLYEKMGFRTAYPYWYRVRGT